VTKDRNVMTVTALSCFASLPALHALLCLLSVSVHCIALLFCLHCTACRRSPFARFWSSRRRRIVSPLVTLFRFISVDFVVTRRRVVLVVVVVVAVVEITSDKKA